MSRPTGSQNKKNRNKTQTKKEENFGTKLKIWDNRLSNTVKDFNEIFNEYLGLDPSTEVEILEPYTHMGRILRINGEEIQHLFNDEDTSEWRGYYLDVYDSSTKKFIKRYKKIATIARDFGMCESHIQKIHRNKYKSSIYIKKVESERGITDEDR